MLPRLQAMERLDRIDDGALASGFVARADRSRALAELERLATGREPERPAPARPEDLAAMGIGVVIANDDPGVSPHDEGAVSNG